MQRNGLWLQATSGIVAIIALAGPAWAGGPAPESAAEAPVTILTGQRAVQLDALVSGDRLWVPVDRLKEVSGFTLKPEGICDANSCYPVPEDKGWVVERSGRRYVDLTSFAGHIAQPVAYDAKERIFSFAAAEAIPGAPLAGGIAPDFTLPNREGELVSLSDFRGKKVLIITWASW